MYKLRQTVQYFTQTMTKPASKKTETWSLAVSLETGNSFEKTVKHGLAPQNQLMT